MSDVIRLSEEGIKGWLERETGSLFLPIHSKSQKLVGEMRKSLDSLSDASKILLENSGKEIDKRNMKTYGRARALNKLARLFLDRIRLIKVPNEITYDNFHEFVQETQRAVVTTEVDVRNWFPRISPFFILDRRKFLLAFERAKASLRDLDDFSAKEYVKAKTMEETFQLVVKLQNLEQQLIGTKEERARTENEKSAVEKEIAGTQQKMADLKGKGSLGQLSQASAEIEALSIEVKHGLQHLQKPFIKLQSLALHGEGSGLTPEEVGKLNAYVANPFEAFATEETNYPLLRQILQKLSRSLSEGKLKLKAEKTRKALQTIESILNKGSLSDLHRKSMDALVRKKRLATSTEVVETEGSLSKMGGQLETLDRKKKLIEGKHSTLQLSCNELAEKIRNVKAGIEKNVLDITSRRIRIE